MGAQGLTSACLGVCCRSQACVGSALPPYKVGNLNSKLFLSEISKREKSLKRTLEGGITNTEIRVQSSVVLSGGGVSFKPTH